MFYTKCYSLYVFGYGGPCKEKSLTGWFFLNILSKWLVKKVAIIFISIAAVTTLLVSLFMLLLFSAILFTNLLGMIHMGKES